MSPATGGTRVWTPLTPSLPYDFTIDDRTFRLLPEALDPKGDPHKVDPVPFLADQISLSPEQLSYADVNRTVDVPIAQMDFSGGLSRARKWDARTSAKQFRWSKGMDTSGPPGFIFPGPAITILGTAIADMPLKALQRGNITYLAAGTGLYQITDLVTLTLDTRFADAITDILVFNGNLYICFGEAATGNLKYRASDTIAGAFTDAGVKATYLCVVQNNPIGPVFYRTLDTTPDVALSTDPTSGTWVSFGVGTTDVPITSITPFHDHVIVGKQDGPWAFTTEYLSFPYIEAGFHTENYATVAKHAIVFRDHYVFTGKHSTYAFKLRTLFGAGERPYPWVGVQMGPIGFDTLYDPQVPGGAYRPDGFTADPHFMYAIIAEQTSGSPVGGVYIWKSPGFGDEPNASGLPVQEQPAQVPQPVWHSYIWRSDLGQGAPLLFATNKLGSVSQNAILFAYKSGTAWQVAWAPWPATIDPTKDSAYTFDTTHTAQLRTLDYDAGLETVIKHSDRLHLIADNLTASAVVDVYAWPDAATSATHVAQYQLSPSQEQKLISPVGENTPAHGYTRASIELDIQAASSSPSAMQQVRGFYMPARYLSPFVLLHTVQLVAMEDQPLATGGRVDPRGSYVRTSGWRRIVDTLRERRKTQAAVDVVDENGRRFSAYLVDIAERTVVRRGDARPVKALTVTLLERG